MAGVKELVIDFSDIPSSAPVEPGEYSVVIQKVMAQDSGSSEHKKLMWTLQITEGEHAGRRLLMQTSLAPKSLWFLRAILEQIGKFEKTMKLGFADDGTVLYPELIGLPCIAKVSQETYQGRLQNRVDDLHVMEGGSVGGGPAVPSSQSPSAPSAPGGLKFM